MDVKPGSKCREVAWNLDKAIVRGHGSDGTERELGHVGTNLVNGFPMDIPWVSENKILDMLAGMRQGLMNTRLDKTRIAPIHNHYPCCPLAARSMKPRDELYH